MHIDAFAGSGEYVSTDYNGFREFHKGSVQIALGVSDKEFDRLVFVEKDTQRYQALETIKATYSNRKIELVNDDANTYLSKMDHDWSRKRGVVFLDPFGTQVAWQTIERIAGLNALDLWILFPVLGVVRLLPRQQDPEAIDKKWVERLDTIYGNREWRDLYKSPPYQDLIDEQVVSREAGTANLIDIYKRRLSACFGRRFLKKSQSLKNSRGSILFEFIFCAGHPRGARLAKEIAGHIVELF